MERSPIAFVLRCHIWHILVHAHHGRDEAPRLTYKPSKRFASFRSNELS